MIQQLLLNELDRLALRRRLLQALRLLAVVWLAAAAACACLWFWNVQIPTSATVAVAVIGGLVLLLAAVCCAIAWSSSRNYSALARVVEAAFPELKSSLITAIEQRPEAPGGEFGYLQSRVMQQAYEHANRHEWEELVSQRKLFVGMFVNVLLFSLFAGALYGAVRNVVNAPEGSPLAALLPGVKPFSMTVEPGNVEVERGTSLLVLARVQGRMPNSGTLQYQATGEEPLSVNMAASLKDPLVSGRIPVVEKPLDYFVTLDSHISPTYRITVFEYPSLERADAKLVYPEFTGLKEKLIEDVRTISAVEGTKLTLICKLNKPVQSAVLSNVKANAPGEPLELKPSAENPLVYETTLVLEQSRKLKLELIDEAGRKNKKNEQFTFNVLVNQPASIKPVFPARDLEVSALEEIDVKAAVTDDFGIRRMGIAYSFAGKPIENVEIAKDLAGKGKHEFTHKFALEDLGAEVDQLLSYYWWVEDFDNAGKPRRTESDMYFAEVRPFEEIFRQGESQPGGDRAQREQQQREQQQQGGQNAQDAQNLAKLQKDIINATWKVIRREISDSLTKTFAEDAEQIRASQATAGEQATALGERLQDEKSQEHLDVVLEQMKTATEQLKSAAEKPSREPLTAALAAEQAAYQSLLKLRAREHEVVRQQQQQQQRGQQQSRQNSARSQQQREQLDQLDLREDENRYETQRSAEEQQQESAQERENRQVLNRLRELARRQHDLNDRLKELQAALEEAKTPKEQEEARKQLERLQDEQRQILQDTDELQSRMDQAESQEKTAEDRQQLEQTRDQVRRASEALEQQRVGQAAAAGSKAEQQFEDLREEFRRRASNRFSSEMQQMRDSARQLEEGQRKIAQDMRETTEPKPQQQQPSLADAPDPTEGTTKQLDQQRERLSQLQDQMRDTIERAETTEPLLSERLYETARQAREQNLDRMLQMTDRLLKQGLPREAQRPEGVASEGVRQLREGIEKAAEGVLGDETEALRRARQELQRLTRELDQELQQNAPAQPNPGEQQGDRNSQPRDSNNPGAKGGAQNDAQQPDEANSHEGQPGEQGQPGEKSQSGKAGQRQSNGQRQGNQNQKGQKGAQRQPGNEGEAQPGEAGDENGQPQEGEPQNGQQPGNQQKGQKGGQKGAQKGGAQQPGGQQEGDQQPGERQSGDEQPGDEPGDQQPGGQKGGQQPGGQKGGQKGAKSGQKGNGQRGGQGQKGQPGEPNGDQPNEDNQPGEPQGENQPGQRAGQKGQRGEGQPRDGKGNPGPQAGSGGGGNREQPGQRTRQNGGDNLNVRNSGGAEEYVPGPLTGERFREWSDRLRDVEEMVGDPQLRADAARIRERARALRAEMQRHSAPPSWDLVRDQLMTPLTELEKHVSEEVLRRTSKKALVPLDRDPVPPEYSEKTSRYYKQLGSGK